MRRVCDVCTHALPRSRWPWWPTYS